jgi:hypothetical protein
MMAAAMVSEFRFLSPITVLALVSHVFITFASATVEVYTALAAWEARVAQTSPLPCISIDDFEDGDIPLVVGTTDVGLFDVTVDAVPFPLEHTSMTQTVDGKDFG